MFQVPDTIFDTFEETNTVWRTDCGTIGTMWGRQHGHPFSAVVTNFTHSIFVVRRWPSVGHQAIEAERDRYS